MKTEKSNGRATNVKPELLQTETRVIPQHEKDMIKKAPYSSPRVIDSGEFLPHPPKKK